MAKKTVRGAVVGASVGEVLDRVLDRGIVIDAWTRVSLVGIRLIDVDVQVIVTSIQTYMQDSDALGCAPTSLKAKQAPAPLSVSRPRRPAPRRARAPHPAVTLQCAQGCTFRRSAARKPTVVRCPSDRQQTCAVNILALAA